MDISAKSNITNKPKLSLIFDSNNANFTLFSFDLQRIICYAIFNDRYLEKPSFIKLLRCDYIKSMCLLFIEDIHSIVDEHDSMPEFKIFNVVSPLNYDFSWDCELLLVPHVKLGYQQAQNARARKSLFVTEKKKYDYFKESLNKIVNCPANIIKKNSSASQHFHKIYPVPPFLKPDNYDRTQLLLDVNQMAEENIPIPISDPRIDYNLYNNFISLYDKYEPVTSNSPMYALDCEMVLTTAGSELARLSITDESNCILLDKFVLPSNPILDYLTKYSGITKSVMASVDTTLSDIHQDLKKILPSNAILVGHSVGNDLKSLKIFHPYLIDTSVIYNLSQRRKVKPKLKSLAEFFLGKKIQNLKSGHSSSEDAKATMDLVRLKLNNYFGDVCTNWRFPKSNIPHSQIDNENIESNSFNYPDIIRLFKSHRKFLPNIRKHVAMLKNSYKNGLFSDFEFSHLCNNLLYCSQIPYQLWPQFPDLAYSETPVSKFEKDENINTEPAVKRTKLDDDNKQNLVSDEPEITVKYVGTTSNKNASFLSELCLTNKVVISQVKPKSEMIEKRIKQSQKFVNRLFERIPSNTILLVVCRGSELNEMTQSESIQTTQFLLGIK